MSARRSLVPVLLLASVVACSGSGGTTGGVSSNEQASLGGEAAARVGGEPIPLALVVKVAADEHIPPREALRHLIDDAVSANGARARGLDRASRATWLLAAARGRWMADSIMAAARAGGPPTDEEVVELTKRHWREVDRPPSVRVVHALAGRPKKPADIPRAVALAGQLRDAVLGAKDDAEFLARAKALAHPADLEVVVESLPPFASDGSLVDAEGGMVEPFARAAFQLAQPGETSGIVETQFGWHVIRLVARLPEQRMPLETRRTAFAEEAFTLRARRAVEGRLSAATKSSPIVILPSAEPLMETLLARGPAQ